MAILLPEDDNGKSIMALGFVPGATQRATVGSISRRIAQPIDEGIALVTLVATGPACFEVGDANVDADAASSPFLYPGSYVDVPLAEGQTHIAFVAVDEDCLAYVMGRR